MKSQPPRGGGLKSFRLVDVPEPIRMRAKERLLRGSDPKLPACRTFSDRIAVGVAAERPSGRIYFVSEAAYERVMHPKNRRTP